MTCFKDRTPLGLPVCLMTVACLGLSLALPTVGSAIPPEVAAEIEEARQQIRPITPKELARWRERVRDAASELEAFLVAGGTPENTQRWKDYLLWDDLQAQLESDEPDLRALQRSAARFYQHEKGLHLPQFTELRDALTSYLSLSALARHPNFKQEYEQQLDELAQALAALEASPHDLAAAERVGAILGWFGRAQRQSDLVRTVRNTYFHPNLVARVSATMVATGINEPVHEVVDISDNILGTTITGSAETHGDVRSELLRSDEAIQVQLVMQGQAVSENVGYNRGVTIWSNSTTDLSAKKVIAITPEGFEALPADAEAATSSDVYALAAKSCLIEKLAWRRVGKTKGQAEVVASQHAAARLAEQMDERVEELLADPAQQYAEKFREPLIRRGEWPDVFRMKSTTDAIRVAIRQANIAQAAAATPAPPFQGNPDVAVRLHETFVSNLSRALVGGVTLTDERLEEILEKAGAEIPDELKTSPDKAPWSITFSARKPVSAEFRDGKVQFAIYGRRFQQGSNVVESPIRLSATYTIERTDAGAKLTRQGDVVVEFTQLSRLGPDEIALRTVMRAKFEALFKPEFVTEGVKLPGRWQDAGALKLAEIKPQHGWLAIGWRLNPPAEADQVAATE